MLIRSSVVNLIRKIGRRQCDTDWAINWTLGTTFLANWREGVKIYHFSSEIIFGQLLETFGDFFWSHWATGSSVKRPPTKTTNGIYQSKKGQHGRSERNEVVRHREQELTVAGVFDVAVVVEVTEVIDRVVVIVVAVAVHRVRAISSEL